MEIDEEDAMTTLEDSVRIAVPSTVAQRLARRRTLSTHAHEWRQSNIDLSWEVLGSGHAVVSALAECLARSASVSPEWAVLALPPLDDGEQQRAAAGVRAIVPVQTVGESDA